MAAPMGLYSKNGTIDTPAQRVGYIRGGSIDLSGIPQKNIIYIRGHLYSTNQSQQMCSRLTCAPAAMA